MSTRPVGGLRQAGRDPGAREEAFPNLVVLLRQSLEGRQDRRSFLGRESDDLGREEQRLLELVREWPFDDSRKPTHDAIVD